jgi:pyruvate/2-oxoglutarate dehydrogenase complex dihydrolipoamide dehydrogenase (E3) component
MSRKQDLIVIGAGPGGLVVASVAAQLGLRVMLVEQSGRLGGDCLHGGCVPSKTLIHMARTAHSARRGAAEGLLSAMPEINFGVAVDRVQQVIDRIQLHDDPERFRGYGCDVRFGKAVFINPNQVSVDEEVIAAKRFVIATGSIPAIPPIPGLEEAGYETNETIFSRRVLPQQLAIIGGGPVGVELAQAFARFGSEVTIIEMADRLLAQGDEELSSALQEVLESEHIRIITAAGTSSVRREGDSRQLVLADGRTVECDLILVAAGRRPATHGMGLEDAGVDFGKQGITVDRRLRTSRKHIFAVGDVCGPYQFTHMAEYHAGIALANIVFRVPRKTDYRVVPRVVYTDPEVAAVGLTEAEASAKGIKYHVARFPMADVDRAITDDEQSGFLKILISKGRVLGASLLGPHAGELIHELALAMKVNAKVKEITDLVHAYPTYAQVHRRTINSSYSHLLKARKVRFLAWFLNRILP